MNEIINNLSDHVIGYYRSTNKYRPQDRNKYIETIKEFCHKNGKAIDFICSDINYNYNKKEWPLFFKHMNDKQTRDIVAPSIKHVVKNETAFHYLTKIFNEQKRNVYFVKENITLNDLYNELTKTKIKKENKTITRNYTI